MKEKRDLYKRILKLRRQWELIPKDEITRRNMICKRLDEMYLRWQAMK